MDVDSVSSIVVALVVGFVSSDDVSVFSIATVVFDFIVSDGCVSVFSVFTVVLSGSGDVSTRGIAQKEFMYE